MTQVEQTHSPARLRGPGVADDRDQPTVLHAFSELLAFVAAGIVDAMDNGRGELAALPKIGTAQWNRSTDRTKWAAVAVAALEGLKLAQRSDEDFGDYAYTTVVVAEEIAFAAEAYKTGYDSGRRDQKAIDMRIARGRTRRSQEGHT
ncbi:hypothetical protein ACHIPZ_04940 [Antrihabitans sp. NCIMB 15449]|uniref:Uncharacterized protein n=1 Tax=Antrihabitans spumae TaxID=3373370 RepID=A0ABW7JII8_9NOCA